MCLPASGQISISQIRNEIYNNGCGPSTYSLGDLATYAGFPANPDAMSEFYNYCCGCNSTTFCYSSVSCYLACNTSPCADQAYFWTGTLTTGTVLRNASCTGSTVPDGYYAYAGNCYTVTGGAGVIASVTSCPPPTTTTTTAAPTGCHNYQATASSYISYTDCCGVFQSYYILVGDTFCAQIGTVYGYYVDLNTNCNC